MSVHIRMRHKLLGGHRHVRVFVGVDKDHLQKSGDLVFDDPQWPPIRDALHTLSEADAAFPTEQDQFSFDEVDETDPERDG